MPSRNENLIKLINDAFRKILSEIKRIFETNSELNILQQKKHPIEQWLNILNKYKYLFKTKTYKEISDFLKSEDLYELNAKQNVNNTTLLAFIKEANIRISTFKQKMMQLLSNYYGIDLKSNTTKLLNSSIIFSDSRLEKSRFIKYDKLMFIQILENLISTLEKMHKEFSINKQDPLVNDIPPNDNPSSPRKP